jgi:hypothetical protein
MLDDCFEAVNTPAYGQTSRHVGYVKQDPVTCLTFSSVICYGVSPAKLLCVESPVEESIWT